MKFAWKSREITPTKLILWHVLAFRNHCGKPRHGAAWYGGASSGGGGAF